MILVERREMIESLLKEILNVLDFEIYEPLYTFMDAEPHVLYLSKNVKIITKVLRSQVARKRLTQVSCSISSNLKNLYNCLLL